MNLSKLVDQDEPLFLSILRDLFPGVNLGRNRNDPGISESLEHNAKEMQLIAHRPWILKVLQVAHKHRQILFKTTMTRDYDLGNNEA